MHFTQILLFRYALPTFADGGTGAPSGRTGENAGQTLQTREEILKVNPLTRTTLQWLMLADPARAVGRFLVIDPANQSGLLYLTAPEYLVMARTCMRTGTELRALSRPEDSIQQLISALQGSPLQLLIELHSTTDPSLIEIDQRSTRMLHKYNTIKWGWTPRPGVDGLPRPLDVNYSRLNRLSRSLASSFAFTRQYKLRNGALILSDAGVNGQPTEMINQHGNVLLALTT